MLLHFGSQRWWLQKAWDAGPMTVRALPAPHRGFATGEAPYAGWAHPTCPPPHALRIFCSMKGRDSKRTGFSLAHGMNIFLPVIYPCKSALICLQQFLLPLKTHIFQIRITKLKCAFPLFHGRRMHSHTPAVLQPSQAGAEAIPDPPTLCQYLQVGGGICQVQYNSSKDISSVLFVKLTHTDISIYTWWLKLILVRGYVAWSNFCRAESNRIDDTKYLLEKKEGSFSCDNGELES